MRIFSSILILYLLLPSCFLHKHSSVVSGSSQQTVITVTVKAENLTEDAVISTHNDEIFCALFKTSHDSFSSVELLAYDMFDMDSVGQERAFTSHPISQNIDGDLSVVLIEMDSDTTKERMAQRLKENYYALAHALTVNDQDTIHSILGDDDLLGMHDFPGSYMSSHNSLWYVIYGQQFFNHYSFRITINSPEMQLSGDW